MPDLLELSSVSLEVSDGQLGGPVSQIFLERLLMQCNCFEQIIVCPSMIFFDKKQIDQYHGKVHFCNRWCFFFLRKRNYCRFAGQVAAGKGLEGYYSKIDPYINVDPGTLNPYEHGECYVTEDGAETDLDLGHYERFLNIFTSQANNVTTGRIYQTVINKEREGAYLGKTVQVVPHITDEIKRRMMVLGQR